MSELFLSILVFLPAAAALVVALMPKSAVDGIRLVTLAATLIVLAMAIYMCIPGDGGHQPWLANQERVAEQLPGGGADRGVRRSREIRTSREGRKKREAEKERGRELPPAPLKDSRIFGSRPTVLPR